ncbi:uncharacterized protein LOC110612552 [Manihot esculenta]|uniref:uncharacterized protein LOC110612552 n=1 Tax=Manihot esculenta TaxID=3983 RepID=UPI001CC4225D|nr:uncharacterized protein LOC110612552 [Manihot esculenta]
MTKSTTRIDALERRVENIVALLSDYATQEGMVLEFDSAYKRIEALEKENEWRLAKRAKSPRGEGEPIELEATQNPFQAKDTRWGDLESKMIEWETVASQVRDIMESLKSVSDAHTSLVGVVEEIRDGAKETIDTINGNVKERMDTFQGKLEELDARVNTIMKITGCNGMKSCGAGRTKVPKPKAFGGARDAKEVDNFLFDMELFFRVTKRESEEDKLLILPLYLVDDAKLWWRNKIVRVGPGANQVTTWDMFAKELRAQFCPENVAYDARCKLGELQQTGSVRDYVRDFSRLMLNIENMQEEDRFYNFMKGLKPWAKNELRRQKVTDVDAAIVAAEGLEDYSNSSSKRKLSSTMGQDPHPNKWVKAQSGGANRLNHTIGGVERRNWSGNVKSKPYFQGRELSSTGSQGSRPQGSSSFSLPRLNVKCFLCLGPHRMVDCPHKGALNSLRTLQEEEKRNEEEEQKEGDNDQSMVGALRFLGAMEKQRASKSSERGLMYVDLTINGKLARALVDTGATNNFIADSFVSRFELKIKEDKGKIKAVNSKAQNTVGVAQSVAYEIGPWKGEVNFTVTPLDDFDVVIGMEFLKTARAVPIPSADCLILMGDRPCVVPTTFSPICEKKLISALQFKKGVRRNKPTYVVVLVMKEEGEMSTYPLEIRDVMLRYKDVMLEKLPSVLPPRRSIDHEIELLPGTKAPAKVPYRMAPPELAELRKQLDELLEAGFIRPAKEPFRASMLFQKKQDGSLRLCVDYRALNKVTVRNKYPIPLIADLFDQLGPTKFFTKLDLRSGYHQVRIKEGDEPKTTCVTRYGAFEFLVMPFGLTNALATFCTLMNQVFHEYLDKFVVVYLDNIVVYSSSLKEHREHLSLVFEKLRENNLFVKKEKCAFAQTRIKFLGHVVEQGKISMD